MISLKMVLQGKYEPKDNYPIKEGVRIFHNVNTINTNYSEEIGHNHAVQATCFWKDELLASICRCRKIIIWDLKTCSIIKKIKVNHQTIKVSQIKFINKETLAVTIENKIFYYSKSAKKTPMENTELLNNWEAKKKYCYNDIFLSANNNRGDLVTRKDGKIIHSLPIHARYKQYHPNTKCPVIEISGNGTGLVSVIAQKCHDIYIFDLTT